MSTFSKPQSGQAPDEPYFDNEFAQAWVGGTFWDGRTPDLSTQAKQPFINPDEMNNTPTNGVYPPPFGGLFRPRRLEGPGQV